MSVTFFFASIVFIVKVCHSSITIWLLNPTKLHINLHFLIFEDTDRRSAQADLGNFCHKNTRYYSNAFTFYSKENIIMKKCIGDWINNLTSWKKIPIIYIPVSKFLNNKLNTLKTNRL
jgi:hypothetical protein